MSNVNKLAIAVLGATIAAGSHAGTFDAATSQAVGVEAATSGRVVGSLAAGEIGFTIGPAYSSSDRLVLSLNNGATFSDAAYRLVQSGTTETQAFSLVTESPDGKSAIEFRAASAVIPAGTEFQLTGSTAVAQPVTVNVPALAAGSEIDIDAQASDLGGVYDFYTSIELFQYANQFSANIDTVANAIVDVNEARLEFTDGASDRIALEFRDAASTIDNNIDLSDDDTVTVVLSGDMTGIESITAKTGSVTRGTATIDLAASTATYEFSASDLKGGNVSAVLDIAVDGETPLSTRTFTVKADLDLETETDKNLVADATAAGSWTINGLQAKVSQLSLNTTGFISWLKVANTGTSAVEVFADIIYTLADGTEGSVSSAFLGEVDAGGIGTISEATILTAMGNPAQLADVHLTVTVTGPNDTVHLIAEKKASEGRVSVPVYYNNGSGRSWFQ